MFSEEVITLQLSKGNNVMAADKRGTHDTVQIDI